MSAEVFWSTDSGPTRFFMNEKYAVRVLCDGEPLTGLFVAFKVLPPVAPDEKSEEARILRASFGNAWRQEWEQERDEETRGYEQRFTLGFVDAEGFLQPVLDVNPWHEIHQQLAAKAAAWAAHEKKWKAKNKNVPPIPLPPVNRNPHSIKLLMGSQLKVCLLRHPNPHLAQALTEYLNSGKDPHGYGFSTWGKHEQLLRDVSVKEDGSVDALALKLGSKPTDYFPRGPKRYGGWTLYLDMPHGFLPEVKEMVGRLQDDLGRLRYPVGGKTPYGGWGSEMRNGQPIRIPSPNRGIFDLQTTSAVNAFQLHASDKWAFKLKDKALAYALALEPFKGEPHRGKPKCSWAYLIGWTVRRTPDLPRSKLQPGVVDVATSFAIHRWLDEGLRKPGSILVELPATDIHVEDPQWNDWPRLELALSIELWREFARALGCHYGLSFGHIFRDVQSAGGVGRAECSIHKTGNAVDLGVKGSLVSNNDNVVDFSQPMAHFPIRFEANWSRDSRSVVGKLRIALERKQRELEAAQKKARAEVGRRGMNSRKELQGARTALGKASGKSVKVSVCKDDLRGSFSTVTMSIDKASTFIAERQLRLTALERLEGLVQQPELGPPEPTEPVLSEVTKLRTAQSAEKLARKALELAEKEDVPVRSAWRIHWRLYGHSTWNVFGVGDDARQRQLISRLGIATTVQGTSSEARWGIEEKLREVLRGYFPRPSAKFQAEIASLTAVAEDGSAPTSDEDIGENMWGVVSAPPDDIEPPPSAEELAQLQAASFDRLINLFLDKRPEVKRCRTVAEMLLGIGGEELAAQFFRPSVKQWIYNPYEASGGHDGKAVAPGYDVPGNDGARLQYLDQSAKVDRVGIPAGVRSFLNLTALGFHCGLLRISANRGGWRDPRTDPGRKVKAPTQKVRADGNLGGIAGILQRMNSNESGEEDDFFFVTSKDSRVAHWIKSVDLGFVADWSQEVRKRAGEQQSKQSSKGRPAALAPARSGKTVSSQMVLTLSARPDEQEQIRELLGRFPDKLFKLVHVGQSVKLGEHSEVELGKTLLQLINPAIDAFMEQVRAKEEAQKDEGAKGGKSQGKKSPAKKSTPKVVDDWTLVLQPYFDLPKPPPGVEKVLDEEFLTVNSATRGPLTLAPGDVLEIPTPGVGRALEWWHYETEHANRTPWGTLLDQIGYSYPLLATPAVPSREIHSSRFNGRGFDFDPAEELGEIKGGGTLADPPENVEQKEEKSRKLSERRPG